MSLLAGIPGQSWVCDLRHGHAGGHEAKGGWPSWRDADVSRPSNASNERCPHEYWRSANGHFDECHTCCKAELSALRSGSVPNVTANDPTLQGDDYDVLLVNGRRFVASDTLNKGDALRAAAQAAVDAYPHAQSKHMATLALALEATPCARVEYADDGAPAVSCSHCGAAAGRHCAIGCASGCTTADKASPVITEEFAEQDAAEYVQLITSEAPPDIDERVQVGPAEDDWRVTGYRIKGPWRATKEEAARDATMFAPCSGDAQPDETTSSDWDRANALLSLVGLGRLDRKDLLRAFAEVRLVEQLRAGAERRSEAAQTCTKCGAPK